MTKIYELRRQARKRLPRMVFDYLEGGAEDEITLERNKTDYDRCQLIPQRLTDLSSVHTATTLFNRSISFPCLIAPTGLNGLFWPNGDIALARAADKTGVPFVLSTASTNSIEEVAAQAGGQLWFQLYVIERSLAESLVRRALAADYECLVLTTDVVVNGKRERDIRNGFGLPFRYTLKTVLDGIRHPAWSYDFLKHGVPGLGNMNSSEAHTPQAKAALLQRSMESSFDWEDLKRLRELWPKKLVVKGVLSADDIRKCVEYGVDAVILSNHGGRQLDTAISAFEALHLVPFPQSIPILLDGGIQRGRDIVKAIALGATSVLSGRAVLYGLASHGEDGALEALRILKDEFSNSLTQLGCASVRQLGVQHVYTRNV
ncbi:alpha-hydroxy-acid oxidizing protein [Paenalcaligenes hominis]|uniref:(S)-mandelate dehydrogenase n=1 Tax=Paenalcaligenes hominis TaxID=643674 RepID=A0ABX0WTB4_9BURK|nr:alpha-hydroxy-acid oxidizing protein [Paenalcaligenes hominis]NJB66013.1 (S)-mandelate dehydrogenase [Paenalcaligenes hominis]GGE71411.1 lactate dehydrogenase [Paenalcaligenes hominis]